MIATATVPFLSEIIGMKDLKRHFETQAHKLFGHTEMHELLIETCLSDFYRQSREDQSFIGAQALMCPYYVPLSGVLGYDWGVIVNPESTRFGLVTFEHDDCGCPKSPDEDEDGSGRHNGSDNQIEDLWLQRRAPS